jgi:hypothetical protein
MGLDRPARAGTAGAGRPGGVTAWAEAGPVLVCFRQSHVRKAVAQCFTFAVRPI